MMPAENSLILTFDCHRATRTVYTNGASARASCKLEFITSLTHEESRTFYHHQQHVFRTYLYPLPPEADADSVHALREVVIELLGGVEWVVEALVSRQVTTRQRRSQK